MGWCAVISPCPIYDMQMSLTPLDSPTYYKVSPNSFKYSPFSFWLKAQCKVIFLGRQARLTSKGTDSSTTSSLLSKYLEAAVQDRPLNSVPSWTALRYNQWGRLSDENRDWTFSANQYVRCSKKKISQKKLESPAPGAAGQSDYLTVCFDDETASPEK